MPFSRVAAALLAGAVSGPVLAQDALDEPVARLALELRVPESRGQLPAVNLLLGSKDQSVAMPLAGPATYQVDGPDGLFSSDLSKWVWWGVSGLVVTAVVVNQANSKDDPAPTGTGAGP